MSARIKIVLPYPPSGNIYWRKTKSGKLYPSEEAKVYKEVVRAHLARQLPLLGKIIMSAELYQPADQGDLDNRLKVLKDAMKFFAYLDDKQVKRYRDLGFNESDPEHPRVEIVLVGDGFATREQQTEAIKRDAETRAKRKATFKRNEELRAKGLMEKPKKKRVKERKDISFPLVLPNVVPPPKVE